MLLIGKGYIRAYTGVKLMVQKVSDATSIKKGIKQKVLCQLNTAQGSACKSIFH